MTLQFLGRCSDRLSHTGQGATADVQAVIYPTGSPFGGWSVETAKHSQGSPFCGDFRRSPALLRLECRGRGARFGGRSLAWSLPKLYDLK